MIFNEVHISSALIQVHPEFMNKIKQDIYSLPFTDLIASSDEGKIIITIECNTEHQITDTLEKINQMKYVMSALLVFHQIEPNQL